jgi:2-polyprenyl-3-methyl-5-hydroxy-6-metoxy-1,4-benzoquinol methylase
MTWNLDLTRRCRRAELMDQPDIRPSHHLQALRGLARINFWSGSARILWPAIRELAEAARRDGLPPLRHLDIACGGGDVPIRLWRRARRAGLNLEVAGCDISPRAVTFAQYQAERSRSPARFFVGNALEGPLLSGYDILTCSLFLHHLAEDEAVTLLRRMAQMAKRLVLVNDLARGLVGYLLAVVGTRILSSSPVVHTDGPRSVESAFSLDEALHLAERAGMRGATIRPRWPCRFLLSWKP